MIFGIQKIDYSTLIAIKENVDFVCSAIKDFNDKRGLHWPQANISSKVSFGIVSYWQMILKNRIATSSVFCRRDLLKEIHFDESLKLVAVEDYDLWLRLMEIKKIKIIRISMFLVGYRKVIGSLSSRKLYHVSKVMHVTKSSFK